MCIGGCGGGASEILLTLRSGVVAAAKIWASKLGTTPPPDPYLISNSRKGLVSGKIFMYYILISVGFPFGSGIYQLMGKVTVFAILGAILLVTFGKLKFYYTLW